MSVLPFLFSAIEKQYEKLPQDQKDAILKAGQFSQILKSSLSDGYAVIRIKESDALGITIEQVDTYTLALAKEMNIDITAPGQLIDKLQAKVSAGLTDSSWDSLWTTVSGQLAIVMGGGSLSWPTLALGLIEFVYRKYVK